MTYFAMYKRRMLSSQEILPSEKNPCISGIRPGPAFSLEYHKRVNLGSCISKTARTFVQGGSHVVASLQPSICDI